MFFNVPICRHSTAIVRCHFLTKSIQFPSMSYLALAILPLILLQAVHGHAVIGPVNTVSVVGSKVTLECASTSRNCSNFDWLKSDPGASASTIYKGSTAVILSGYTQRYSVDNSTGCHLVIKDVRRTDAGRYTCTVSILQSSVKADAYLIVMESEPQCSVNASQDTTVEGDGVKLTCGITYNGKENVSLVWRDVEGVHPVEKRGNNIIRYHSLNASAPEIPSYTCIISFPVLVVTDTATNVPTTNCTTPVTRILFPVKNAHLWPSQTNYSPGANITCLAEGRPDPSFQWQILEMENGNNGTWRDIPNATSSHLVVHNVTENWHRCVAMNDVKQNTHSAVSPSFQVNDAGHWLSQSSYVILIAVGSSVVFVILVAVVCSVRRCKGSGNSLRGDMSERTIIYSKSEQTEAGYLQMDISNTKEVSGYVDVHRPVSSASCISE